MQKKNDGVKASKVHGRIYTPASLVCLMLDYVDYRAGEEILHRHVIDNSCGDGAFLCEVARRYCEAYITHNSGTDGLAEELQTYVHGIELDRSECCQCVDNLNAAVCEYGLTGVAWDVICADALTVDKYNGRMDYVVGNPPYVRVHNLQDSFSSVKRFRFANGGMTDLFLVFFELCFNMMSRQGRMCIITPSSWLKSVAGENLRKHIMEAKNLSGLIDLGHFQVFNATTYTLISRFDMAKHEALDYKTLDGQSLHDVNSALMYRDMCICGRFYLSDGETLKDLYEIFCGTDGQAVKVKNGFATLADKVFIGSFGFQQYTIPVVKASTGEWKECVFPYDCNGKLIKEETMAKCPEVYTYLVEHKELLTKGRDAERGAGWYAFGRSQAINDVFRNKIAINSLVKDIRSIKMEYVAAGKGVYSGLYILTERDFAEIERVLKSDDFINYLRALKNYKSGGYYTFSSKELELFLNHKIQKHNEQ